MPYDATIFERALVLEHVGSTSVPGLSAKPVIRTCTCSRAVARKSIACFSSDWLRANDRDRMEYERTKRKLAARTWKHVQDYADAKTEQVRAILELALAARRCRIDP